MQRTELALWVIAAVVLWFGVSWYWYTCSIKGFCPAPVVRVHDADGDDEVIPVQYRNNTQVASMYNSRSTSRTTRVVSREETTITCSGYLNSYIRYGNNNRTQDVERLERFLNEYENEDVDVDGFYSRADEQAVKRFQEKYRSEIMEPWGMTTPSGYVYSRTLNQINSLHCAYEYAHNN